MLLVNLIKNIQVKKCIRLIRKYNSNTSSDNAFDLDRCNEILINMSLEEINKTIFEVRSLLRKQKELAFLDKIIEETKLYGSEYVKKKYLINE